ncbi:MAG: M15 family metallopeptidase [Treponema sp.]|nr:M15 family metallopeptidase [Treponema sp.]
MKCSKPLALLLFCGACGACGGPVSEIAVSKTAVSKTAVSEIAVSEAASGDSLSGVLSPVPSALFDPGGETVMKTLALAYPGVIGPAVFINGDWAAPIRGVLCYWAEGRLLPEEKRSMAGQYDPYEFYAYPAVLPEWREPDPVLAEWLENETERYKTSPVNRNPYFLDSLYRSRDEEESSTRLSLVSFLGRRIPVHYLVLEELFLVEEQIKNAAKISPAVQQWIENLALTKNPQSAIVVSWKYRVITGTRTKSFHSYGAALDLVPDSFKGLEHYWAWTREKQTDWWNTPYDKRYQPPEEVIRAFESYGFIWGGKWEFFDTGHFEYRPEILMLNGIPMAEYR